VGWESLDNLTNGGHNIALGYQAGLNVMAGNNNIQIGHAGNPADTGTIRIGVEGTQSGAYLAGIYGEAVSGATATAVYVDNSGHLGTVYSLDLPLPAGRGEPDPGVALAAIQGLNQKLEEQLKKKDAQIQELRQSMAELKKQVQALAEKK